MDRSSLCTVSGTGAETQRQRGRHLYTLVHGPPTGLTQFEEFLHDDLPTMN